MQGLDWNDLRHVLAVARTGSLAGAAARLGVNESTVVRRLAQVERTLGARLFDRDHAGCRPTAAGITVVARAERMEREAEALEDAVSGADRTVGGTVRLTTVPVVANHLLVPALPKLLAAHPALELELVAEPRDLSLARREADVALRLARPTRETRTIARRIGRLDYAVYALGSRAGPLPWVTYEDAMRDLPQARWLRRTNAAGSEARARVRVNDAEQVLRAVEAGIGRSLLPVAVAARSTALVRLDTGPAPVTRDLWLLVHPELRALPRVRVVLEWLAAIAEQLPRAD